MTVFGALRAAAAQRWGGDLDGRTVGVLGVGKVGGALARLAARDGARLVVADADAERAERLASELPGAEAVAPEQLPRRALDVLAPCATGGLLTAELAEQLQVGIVCGAANNMLADDGVADRLARRGILYVPDFVANAGGIVHVGGAFLGWQRQRTQACVDAAIERSTELLAAAVARGTTPLAVALERAAARLDAARRAPRAGYAEAAPTTAR